MAQVNLGRVVGYSAYEIAVQNGFEGTEQEWLASLKGETGNTGATGADGDDGTTFTPSVSAEGVISWTNDGGKVNPPSVNIKGPQGIQGPQGPTGPAGTYTEGTGIDIDNGVLSVDTTVVAMKSDLGDELPPIVSGDAGKVLKVNAGETAVEWANDASQTYTGGTGIDITSNVISVDNTVAMKSDIPAAELPTISSGDAGKALVVNSGETGVEWATVGGGGSSMRKITYTNLASLSADDKAYLTNLYTYNDFTLYPCIIYNDDYAYTYDGRQGVSNGLLFVNADTNKGIKFIINNDTVANVQKNQDVILPNEITVGSAIRVVGGGNTLASNLQAIKDGYATKTELLPACPTTSDSTFQLQCVVSGGVATYSWVDIVPHPTLTRLWLGYGEDPDVTDILDYDQASISGEVTQWGSYHWHLDDVTIPEAISSSNGYGWTIAGYLDNDFMDENGGTPEWVNNEYMVGWSLYNGPSEIDLHMTAQSDTTCDVDVYYNPNWNPPAPSSTLTTFIIKDSTGETTLYNGTNLNIQDNMGTFALSNIDLGVTLAANDELLISYAIEDGSSGNDYSVTLATESDYLAGTLNDPNNSLVAFFGLSSTEYDIEFTIGGQN